MKGGSLEEEKKGVIRFSHDGGCMRENVVTLHELLPFQAERDGEGALRSSPLRRYVRYWGWLKRKRTRVGYQLERRNNAFRNWTSSFVRQIPAGAEYVEPNRYIDSIGKHYKPLFHHPNFTCNTQAWGTNSSKKISYNSHNFSFHDLHIPRTPILLKSISIFLFRPNIRGKL